MGISSLKSSIALLITDFASSFNVFTPMNDDQIISLAEELAVDWWHYTLEDLACFFHRAKRQEFRNIIETSEKVFVAGEGMKTKTKIVDRGPLRITNRVDRQIILEMLQAYDRERLEAFFEHESKGHELTSKPLPPEFQEGPYSFADVIRCLKEGIPPEQIIEEKKSGVPANTHPEEDPARKAEILQIQVGFFCDDVETWEVPESRWKMEPFAKGNEDLIIAELKRRKDLKNG